MSNRSKKERSDLDLTKEAYEQNWLHGRHVENERLWFTTIYGAITASIYTILGQSLFARNLYPLLFVHIIISVFGLIIALKLSAEYHRHNEVANRILEEYNPEYVLRPIERTVPQGSTRKAVGQIVTVKNSFFQIYMFLITGSVYLLVSYYPEIFQSWPKLPISTEWLILGLLVVMESLVTFIYAKVLKRSIYYAKCTECGRVIQFDKPRGTVACSKCGQAMKLTGDRYVCPCGYSIRFDTENRFVICENKEQHSQKSDVRNEYKRLI